MSCVAQLLFLKDLVIEQMSGGASVIIVFLLTVIGA